MVLTGDYGPYPGKSRYIGDLLIEQYPDAVRVWPDIKDRARRRQLHAIRKAVYE